MVRRPDATLALARRHAWALGAVVVASLVVRLLPLVPFALWGSDSGEYLFLTERLVGTGRVGFAYDGWGVAYPYFPGHFVLDGASRLVLGLDPLDALRFTLPVLASVLLPLGTFLLARRAVGDVRVALLAAAFVALTPVNALVTSHPMPGTLGHVLALAGIVALAHAYDERAYLPFALLFAVALVPSHHLSTWFFAGGVATILVVREAARSTWDHDALRVEVPVLAAAVLPAGAWWLGVAEGFRDGILGAVGLPPLVVGLAGYALLGLVPLAVVARRRLAPRAGFRATYPSPHVKAALVAALAGAILAVLLAMFASRIPGGNIHVTPYTLVYTLPVVAWLAFSLAGLRTLRLHDRGVVFHGWTLAILASLLFAVLTESRLLFPFRHPDYLVEALAVPLAFGMVTIYDDLLRASDEREARTVRRTAAAALVVLIAVSFLMSQPPREAIGGFEEGTTRAEYATALWAAENLPEGSVVAADHRLSSLLFGLAEARPTWDFGGPVYRAEDAAAARAALDCAQLLDDPCARVEYVVLSTVIAEGLVTVQWQDAEPLSAAALEKFADPRLFELMHRVDFGEDDAWLFRVVR